MRYYLAIPAIIVNIVCMVAALTLSDTQTFLIAWSGTSFAFYGWLHFTDEATREGDPPMGYRDLARRLRWEFKEEGIRPGSRLPSLSDIARRHTTTRTTVTRALRILVADGLIETVPGRGTYLLGDNGNRGNREDQPRDRVEAHLTALADTKAPGDPMPSVNTLSTILNASASTVRRAIANLARRGVIRRTTRGYVRT